MHRNPQVYANPDQFQPERFLPENNVGRHPHAFLAFSAGPRNCIGKRFAMIQLKVVLSTLLRRFRFTAPDGVTELMQAAGETLLNPADDFAPVLVHRRTA